MAMEKRKRSANWMASEKSLLLNLVTEHFNIIENKRTDCVSMKQKLAEWVIISDKYNSQTMLTHRTSENLKAQWESLKKAAKKEASLMRMHFFKTGGGPSKPKTADPFHERIISLITPSAVGLHNPYNRDCLPTEENEFLPDEEHIVDVTRNIKLHAPVHTAPEPITTMTEEVLTLVLPSTSEEPTNASKLDIDLKAERTSTMDWGDYTPKLLQTPVSKQLRIDEDTERQQGKTWTSKRRPHLPASSLEKLHSMKIKAIEVQMEHAAQEREEGNKMFAITMEIKKETLKQERLKTRLLLLELRNKKQKK